MKCLRSSPFATIDKSLISIILISLIIISSLVPASNGGLFRRNKKEGKGDVVVISAGESSSPVVLKGKQGLNILLSAGTDGNGGGSSAVVSGSAEGGKIVTGGSGPLVLNGDQSNSDMETSASEPEPSKILTSTNSIAKSLTDLVTSESAPSARLSTPEIFNKLMKMPASKFDKIADKLIQDALMGTANSILSGSAPPSGSSSPLAGSPSLVSELGSGTSASSISSRRVPFIPLAASSSPGRGILPPGLMSSFLPPALKLPLMMAAAASGPVPVPIATIRLPVFVPDNDDNDSFEETSSSNGSNGRNNGNQASSSSDDRPSSASATFDESKIPPPVKDTQSQYDDSGSFERPNYDRSNYDHRPSTSYYDRPSYDSGTSYNDRPRAEPYSSTTHIEHSTNADSPAESFPPSTSAHSDHRPYTDEDRKEVVHTYSSGPDGQSHNDRTSYSGHGNSGHSDYSGHGNGGHASYSGHGNSGHSSSAYNSRPMTSASSAYPLLPSYTQSLPFTSYPIPITALNTMSPNVIPLFAASSSMSSTMSSPSSSSSAASRPFVHSSAHPISHLNKLLHNGYIADINKIPQPFSYNHNHGLGNGARAIGTPGQNSYERLQQSIQQQMLAASSSPTRSSRGFFGRSFGSFPPFRPLFGANSVLSKTFAKPPPSLPSFVSQATRATLNPQPMSSATMRSGVSMAMPSGQQQQQSQKTYPILDTSSSTPKIYHAPHNPVDILKIFADAYSKQGLPDAVNKHSRSSSSSSSPSLASTLFRTKSLFSRPLLTSRSGFSKLASGGSDLKAIVTLPVMASSTPTETTLDTSSETRHFPIFVKVEDGSTTESPILKKSN